MSDEHHERVVDLAREWCGIEPFPELLEWTDRLKSAVLMLRANKRAGLDQLMKFDFLHIEDALAALWTQFLKDATGTYDGEDGPF